jgi:hypothetical protein
MPKIWTSTILIFVLVQAGYSQTLINGMVSDSATFQPLPNVNIQVQSKTYGTVTDARGFFKIQVRSSDTLLLSMVGYNSRIIPVTSLKDSPVIYLREQARILKTIEIDADILIPGLDKMKVMQAWENPSNTYAKTPGFQGIETFGPGAVIGGGELQHNREEKKVKQLRANRDKTVQYVEMVNSTAIKDKLMRDFNLSEDRYFALIAAFNQKNKDIIYDLSEQELTSLLALFFSETVNKK